MSTTDTRPPFPAERDRLRLGALLVLLSLLLSAVLIAFGVSTATAQGIDEELVVGVQVCRHTDITDCDPHFEEDWAESRQVVADTALRWRISVFNFTETPIEGLQIQSDRYDRWCDAGPDTFASLARLDAGQNLVVTCDTPPPVHDLIHRVAVTGTSVTGINYGDQDDARFYVIPVLPDTVPPPVAEECHPESLAPCQITTTTVPWSPPTTIASGDGERCEGTACVAGEVEEPEQPAGDLAFTDDGDGIGAFGLVNGTMLVLLTLFAVAIAFVLLRRGNEQSVVYVYGDLPPSTSEMDETDDLGD